MNATHRVWIVTVAMVGFAAAFACRSETKPQGAKPAASGELDGMQLAAARRVALESAEDAMERRDLERLRMLGRWVRGRAQVVLFEPDDLTSLDTAIGCLDHSVPPRKALASLEEVQSGRLLRLARNVCSEAP